MSHLAFFTHANVFHDGGQPIPIERSGSRQCSAPNGDSTALQKFIWVQSAVLIHSSIEQSIASIPEDSKDPEVIRLTVDHSNLIRPPMTAEPTENGDQPLNETSPPILVRKHANQRDKPSHLYEKTEDMPTQRDKPLIWV
ncbi:hypothetical protein TNCV_1306811 [Trichonephila clavipes]|nr:hypothetical protein TNCV_1306811 [Trichonephila clavipes]